MAGFTVTNPKLLNKNTLVGSFDLQMPSGLIVRGAMLFEKSGKRWKPDGTKSYFPLLEFASRDIGERFQQQVLPLAERALL